MGGGSSTALLVEPLDQRENHSEETDGAGRHLDHLHLEFVVVTPAATLAIHRLSPSRIPHMA